MFNVFKICLKNELFGIDCPLFLHYHSSQRQLRIWLSVHAHRHTSISQTILIGRITSISSENVQRVQKSSQKRTFLLPLLIFRLHHSPQQQLRTLISVYAHRHTLISRKKSHWSYIFYFIGKCPTCSKIVSKMDFFASIAHFLVVFLQILRELELAKPYMSTRIILNQHNTLGKCLALGYREWMAEKPQPTCVQQWDDVSWWRLRGGSSDYIV